MSCQAVLSSGASHRLTRRAMLDTCMTRRACIMRSVRCTAARQYAGNIASGPPGPWQGLWHEAASVALSPGCCGAGAGRREAPLPPTLLPPALEAPPRPSLSQPRPRAPPGPAASMAVASGLAAAEAEATAAGPLPAAAGRGAADHPLHPSGALPLPAGMAAAYEAPATGTYGGLQLPMLQLQLQMNEVALLVAK